jgi:hypothetical protein
MIGTRNPTAHAETFMFTLDFPPRIQTKMKSVKKLQFQDPRRARRHPRAHTPQQ